MTRVYNFAAGPATLPLEVLEQAQGEMLDWHGLGVSVMELGHRTAAFRDLAASVEQQLRDLLAIPSNYRVLFMQGGARVQFAMLALNLLRGKSKADYVDTGIWSQIAAKEAERYCQVHTVASSEGLEYKDIPPLQSWQCSSDAAYMHYTDNETVQGVEFLEVPVVAGAAPLVSDMTSSLLSKPLDISQFGLIYAGAQKNLGIAGLSVVIVREDLVGQAHAQTPMVFDYQVAVENQSLYATPPTYPWYIMGLVCDWIKQQGGVAALAAINARKANKLYQYIDASDFYHNDIALSCRSRMNVVFTVADATLEKKFLSQAEQQGLAYLKGHRFVGGMRASIYNALPESGVDALLSFMDDFATRHAP